MFRRPGLVRALIQLDCKASFACLGQGNPGYIFVSRIFKHWSNKLGIFDWLFGNAGKTFKELSERLQIPEDKLKSVNIAYTKLTVSKRDGSKRHLSAPEPELCKFQKCINKRLLSKLRVHFCIKGFCKGESIVTNAIAHVNKAVVIKLDIENFFNDTIAKRVRKYFKGIGWNNEVADYLTRLCTHDGGLPQGAPTSPTLSNIVNYQMDARLFAMAQAKNFVYTRYADDMTFSSNVDCSKKVRLLIKSAYSIFGDFSYSPNFSKQFVARQHVRQSVTGLVVNEKVQLPRETRRWLRAIEHSFKKNGCASISKKEFQGWQALQRMIKMQRA